MRQCLLGLVLVALVGPTFVSAQDQKPTAPFFGNAKCPITGKAVKPDLFAEKDGERVYTCCAMCLKKANEDFAAAKAKAYPEVKDLGNKMCPLMPKREAKAEKFVVFQGHKISVCCPKCLAAFKAEPQKGLALAMNPKLRAVANKTCPVMEGEAVVKDKFVIYQDHLVNICCDDCVAAFAEKPTEYLKALGIATEKPKTGDEKKGEQGH